MDKLYYYGNLEVEASCNEYSIESKVSTELLHRIELWFFFIIKYKQLFVLSKNCLAKVSKNSNPTFDVKVRTFESPSFIFYYTDL